jgi:hypothetical protein
LTRYIIISFFFISSILLSRSVGAASFVDIEELINYYPQFIDNKIFEIEGSIYVMVTKNLNELMDTKRWLRNSAKVIESERTQLRIKAANKLMDYLQLSCVEEYERIKKENKDKNISMNVAFNKLNIGIPEKLISKRYTNVIIEAYKYIKNETWDNDYVCNIRVSN